MSCLFFSIMQWGCELELVGMYMILEAIAHVLEVLEAEPWGCGSLFFFFHATYFCRYLHFFILFITETFKSHVKQFYHLTYTVKIWAVNYYGFLFFCLHLVKAHHVPGNR